MRILIFVLAVLWGMEAGAQAADIRFGGEFRVRSFYTNNLTDAHDSNGTGCPGPTDSCDDQEVFNDARFRLKVLVTEGLATGVVIVDFFNNFGGSNVATINTSSTGTSSTRDGTGDRTLGSAGFGRSLDTLSLREGYLRVSWPAVNLIIGRQGIKLGHGLILDDTADAIAVAIPMGWSTLTLLNILLDTKAQGSGNSSAYLANLNMVPWASFRSSLFVMFLNDRGPNLSITPCPVGSDPECPISDFGDDQAVLYTLGWTMDFEGKAFGWGTELDYLTGTIRTNMPTGINTAGDKIGLRGFNALGKFGWTGKRVDAEITGLYASGQNPDDLPPTGDRLNLNAVSPNFVLGNILVNNETISDRDGGNVGELPGGLTAARLAVGWKTFPNLRTELSGIWARLSKEPAPGESRNLGWELDVNTDWQLDQNLMLASGFGILFTGEAWKTLMSDPEAINSMVKLSTKLIFTF